jgi:hypothetical protein
LVSGGVASKGFSCSRTADAGGGSPALAAAEARTADAAALSAGATAASLGAAAPSREASASARASGEPDLSTSRDTPVLPTR